MPPPVGPLPGPRLSNVTGLQLLFFLQLGMMGIALKFEVDGCVVIVICELRVWWWCEYLNWCPMAVFLVGETYWYHGKLSPCIDVSCGCNDVAAS